MTQLLDIGPALVAARRGVGLSQRELGHRIGVAQQQIARWEATGYRSASLERVDAVARALGLRMTGATALPLAAEAQAIYGAPAATAAPAGVSPVRDLGEIAARIRAHGRELRERFGIVRVGVFGSFATGEQTGTSDVDLLVEMPEPGGFKFIRAADHVEEILGRKVDFVRPDGLHPRLSGRILREVIDVWSA